MSISSVGKTRFKIYGALLLVDIIILGLSGHINQFQEFYYKADLVPFGLALATAIWLSLMIFLDVRSKNATTARPAFELTWLCIMNLLWLGFNAFSTNRWKSIGWSLCKTIPDGDQYSPYRTWCKEVQGVRAFIWVEWILLLISFTYLLHWTLKQHHSGRKDVWSTSFSRFQDMQSRPATRAASEFLQWEKFEQSGGSLPVTQAPSPLNNPIDPFHPGYAIEPTVSRDSSIPPMGTAYGRAQYAQRHQQQPPQTHAQIYDNAYANDSYQVDGAEHPQYGHGSRANVSGYPIRQYGGPAHGF